MITHGRVYVAEPRFACSTSRLDDLMEQNPQRFCALKIEAANFYETFERMYQTAARDVTCDVLVVTLCVFWPQIKISPQSVEYEHCWYDI
jgi:hypothetical protein